MLPYDLIRLGSLLEYNLFTLFLRADNILEVFCVIEFGSVLVLIRSDYLCLIGLSVEHNDHFCTGNGVLGDFLSDYIGSFFLLFCN